MNSLDSIADIELKTPDAPWKGPVPVPDAEAKNFALGLQERRLLILRCDECSYWVHPPSAVCPSCQSTSLKPKECSGKGIVYSFSVVLREFAPGVEPPYAVALVGLAEQPESRLITNIVNCKAGSLSIGMPVRIVYHPIADDSVLALFEPSDEELRL